MKYMESSRLNCVGFCFFRFVRYITRVFRFFLYDHPYCLHRRLSQSCSSRVPLNTIRCWLVENTQSNQESTCVKFPSKSGISKFIACLVQDIRRSEKFDVICGWDVGQDCDQDRRNERVFLQRARHVDKPGWAARSSSLWYDVEPCAPHTIETNKASLSLHIDRNEYVSWPKSMQRNFGR
jgi:hypothetical protein